LICFGFYKGGEQTFFIYKSDFKFVNLIIYFMTFHYFYVVIFLQAFFKFVRGNHAAKIKIIK